MDLGKYATVEKLESEIANLELTVGDSITVRTLNVTAATSTDSLYVATNASIEGSLTIGGTKLKLLTKSLLTGNTTNQVSASGGVVTNVTLNRKYTEFHYLGYE